MSESTTDTDSSIPGYTPPWKEYSFQEEPHVQTSDPGTKAGQPCRNDQFNNYGGFFSTLDNQYLYIHTYMVFGSS